MTTTTCFDICCYVAGLRACHSKTLKDVGTNYARSRPTQQQNSDYNEYPCPLVVLRKFNGIPNLSIFKALSTLLPSYKSSAKFERFEIFFWKIQHSNFRPTFSHNVSSVFPSGRPWPTQHDICGYIIMWNSDSLQAKQSLDEGSFRFQSIGQKWVVLGKLSYFTTW